MKEENVLPETDDLIRVCRYVKRHISPEYRVSTEDDQPGIQLTIGWSPETGEWDYQTGDNSFTGAAYLYPVWAVTAVYEDSDCHDVASDILNQLEEMA